MEKVYNYTGKITLLIILAILALNLGKWTGIITFKILDKIGLIPYLENFFGWFVI